MTKLQYKIWEPDGFYREDANEIKLCSRCKSNHLPIGYYGALSRADNETEVCSQCGTEEALIDFKMQMNAGNPYQEKRNC